jgi:hypothetical protein
MSRKKPVSSPSLNLEPLEPRLLLSGNVTVEVSDGDLVIKGDLQDNKITIEQTGDRQYTVTGVDSTTVNGGASFVANDVRDDFRLDMLCGDDFVDIIGNTTVPDDLRVDLGEGHNRLRLSANSSDNVIVKDDLKVYGGSGNDLVQLWYFTEVGDDVRIHAGDGNNYLEVWNDTLILGNLDVRMGEGADKIEVWNSVEIRGKVDLWTGGSDDQAEIWNEATILGKLDIRTGDGGDVVLIDGSGSGVTINGKTKISTDDKVSGDDTVEISDAEFERDLKIDTASAAGVDTVRIDDTTVAGKVDIRTAKGSEPDFDTVEIGLFAGGGGLEAMHLKIRTGGGGDIITLANSTIASRAHIRADQGWDVVEIYDNDVLKSLLIKMGDGDDTLLTDGGGNFVGKRTLLDGGPGDDTLTTDLNTFNGEKVKDFEIIT